MMFCFGHMIEGLRFI